MKELDHLYGETVKAKLGEIRGKCIDCHAKIRDKQ